MVQKNNFLKIIWVLFYVSVFLFLLKNSYNYLDPDLGWHLRVGEQILKEKQVPDINYYNYTLNGKRWVDHEWLSNAAMYWLYQNFGYVSVNLLFALILLATLIILNIFTQKQLFQHTSATVPIAQKTLWLKSVCFIAFFQILGILAVSPHVGVRVQEITLLNFLLLLIIIHHYEKAKNLKLLFWLLPLFYFWACSHAGFLIGLFVLFFWIFVKSIELIIKKHKPLNFTSHFLGNTSPMPLNKHPRDSKFTGFDDYLNFKHIKIFLLFSLLSVLITFLTPYGPRLYLFLNSYKNTYYLKHIQEWLPVYYLPIPYWQLLYSALVAAVIILLIAFFIKKNKNTQNIQYPINKINIWQIAISLLFLLLSFKSKRHFPLLFIASFPMLVVFFSDYFYSSKKTLIEKSSKLFLLIKSYIIIALLIIILITFININFITDPFFSFCLSFPCQTVKFLKKNPQYRNLNIFNNYDWGGYLIWVWPEKQLFIDGRLPQYEFAGHTMLEEYHEFFKKDKIESKLNQYNIKLVLLKIDQKYRLNWFEKYLLQLNEARINTDKDYLKNYLDNSNNWQKVYNDDISNVYVKK